MRGKRAQRLVGAEEPAGLRTAVQPDVECIRAFRRTELLPRHAPVGQVLTAQLHQPTSDALPAVVGMHQQGDHGTQIGAECRFIVVDAWCGVSESDDASSIGGQNQASRVEVRLREDEVLEGVGCKLTGRAAPEVRGIPELEQLGRICITKGAVGNHAKRDRLAGSARMARAARL